jgi:hypothetical protein
VALGPDLVEELHEAVVDHKGDGHVQADAAHARQRPLVEGACSLLLHNASEKGKIYYARQHALLNYCNVRGPYFFIMRLKGKNLLCAAACS